MAKKTGVKLGLKNLGIESGGGATGLEEIFGLASTPEPSTTPRRKRRSKGSQAEAGGNLTFGEIDILAAPTGSNSNNERHGKWNKQNKTKNKPPLD